MRANLLEVDRIGIFAENDAVRVAHGNAGDFVFFVKDSDLLFDGSITREIDRDLRGHELRFAHIDRDSGNFAVFDMHAADLDAAFCLDMQNVFLRDAAVVDILCNAADTVAAHHALTAVEVIHAHSRIGRIGRANVDDAVAADAGVAVGKIDCELGVVLNIILEAVNIHVIICTAVHFGKRDLLLCPGARHARIVVDARAVFRFFQILVHGISPLSLEFLPFIFFKFLEKISDFIFKMFFGAPQKCGTPNYLTSIRLLRHRRRPSLRRRS